MASERDFCNVSEYIRFFHNQCVGVAAQTAEIESYQARYPKKLIRSFHKTRLGEMVWGDSRAYLFHGARAGSVDLIMTSRLLKKLLAATVSA